jgi:hypothetical protein
MAWPVSQDYNEAIQSLAASVSDPELKLGQAVTNALGIPLPRSGNFADVYEVRGPDGGRWAVKCFTREVPGLHERYQEISRHLRQVQLPFTVDFTFLQQGIRIGGRWYPLLKMEWVEGLTLNEFVRQYVDKPARIDALLHIWGRMARRLREAGIAHGDLQHGNLLLVPHGANALAVKLIDYDGMFVPALAGHRSDEVGHPSYQHPRRLRERSYGPEVDRFPLLLIAAALHSLKVGGRALWEKYDNGDNLLFREADLQAPVKSPLFYELLKLGDPTARRLVDQLLEGLKGGLESVPLLDEAIPELAVTAAPPAAVSRPSRVVLEPVGAAIAQPPAEDAWATIPPPADARRRKKKARHTLAAWLVSAVVAASLGVLVWSYRDRLGISPAAPSGDDNSIQLARNDSSAPPPLVPTGGDPAAEGKPPSQEEILAPRNGAQTGGEPANPPHNPPVQPSANPPAAPLDWGEALPLPKLAAGPMEASLPPKREDRGEALPLPKEDDPAVVVKQPVNPPDPPAEKTPTGPVVDKPLEPRPAAAKAAGPDEAALALAVKEIKEAYQDDYARLQTSAAGQALAAKLFAVGLQLKDNPVKRYAFYREARDLAARSAAPALSLQAVEEMAKEYPVDLLEAKTAAMQLAAKSLPNPASAKTFLDAALPLLKEARAADAYAAVAPLVPLSRQAVQIARDPALGKTANPFLADMEQLGKHYAGIKSAVQKLKDKPDDPDANRAVGEFFCFYKQDWEKGLPLLSEGGDAAMAEAARKELANPTTPAAQMVLGDAWFDLVKTRPELRVAMQKRACRWYVRALPELKDADKDRIEDRVLDLTERRPELRTAWGHLDLAATKVTVVGDAYLRVSPGRVLSIKNPVAGPVEINVVLRTIRRPPHFDILAAGDVRYGLELKDEQIRFSRVGTRTRGGLSSSRPFSFTPNRWYKFTCRLTESGMDISVDGRLLFRDGNKYNLARPQPIRMILSEPVLEIRSFTATPINP